MQRLLEKKNKKTWLEGSQSPDPPKQVKKKKKTPAAVLRSLDYSKFSSALEFFG